MPKIGLFLLTVAVAVLGTPTPRGPLDGLVNKVLEGLRPDLAELEIPAIDTSLNSTGILIDITTSNLTTEFLDTFTTVFLDTSLIPVKIKNLTLHWDEVFVNGSYTLDGTLDADVLEGPVDIYGDGEASLTLRDLTLEAIATFTASQGHLQVKSLDYLGANLGSSNVTLTNFFDGGNLEEIFNVFFSFFIPNFVNDFGDAVLEVLKPNITEKLNEILRDIDFP